MPAKGRGRGVAKAAVAKPAAKAAVGRAGAAAVKREAPESVKASVKAEAPQQAGRGTKRDREEQSLPSLVKGRWMVRCVPSVVKPWVRKWKEGSGRLARTRQRSR